MLPEGLNHTHVYLILKVKNLIFMSKYRPTSLYNVIMKIVTKVIANRLKVILGDIIDESHSAFVHG